MTRATHEQVDSLRALSSRLYADCEALKDDNGRMTMEIVELRGEVETDKVFSASVMNENERLQVEI